MKICVVMKMMKNDEEMCRMDGLFIPFCLENHAPSCKSVCVMCVWTDSKDNDGREVAVHTPPRTECGQQCLLDSISVHRAGKEEGTIFPPQPTPSHFPNQKCSLIN